jgi:hypothetical protein
MTPDEAGIYIQDQIGVRAAGIKEQTLEEDMQDFARHIAASRGFPDGKAVETSPGVWTIYLMRPIEYVTVTYTRGGDTGGG